MAFISDLVFKNISLFDNLIIYFDYLRKRISDLLIIKSMIKNWRSVLLFRLGIKKAITLNFRDNYNIEIHNMREYARFWDSKKGQYYISKHYGYNKKIKIKQKVVKFNFGKKSLLFFYEDDNQLRNIYGTIKENFVDEQFKLLNVKNRVVVDIGANVGDTAIYFALKDAKQVYAFEPYPYSYNLAKKNIGLNKLNDKITILNEGCGGINKWIIIDGSFKNNAGSELRSFKNGVRIRVTTLSNIVTRYKIQNSILKIDCEGCEYGLVLNSPINALNKFNQIMIEYHYGYKNLEKKLVMAKFNVKHTRPILLKDINGKKMILGMIYASKNSDLNS